MGQYKEKASNILFHFDSLWGVGHLVRSARLIEGLADKFNCYAVCGARAQAFIKDTCHATYLPQLLYSEDYSRLYSMDGASVASTLDTRMEICTKTFFQAMPDAVVLEMFPYGRHALWQEVMALLELCREHSVPIYTSLRDIYIYPSAETERAQYIDNIAGILNKFRIKTIIHSDPLFSKQNNALPIELLTHDVDYVFSGYVGRIAAEHEHEHDVIPNVKKVLRVAIGGGRKGVSVYKIALFLLDAVDEFGILYIHESRGLELSDEIKSSMYSKKGKDVRFVEFTPDFAFSPLPFSNCWIVSGGYNSAMDILSLRIPSIIVGLDQEQRIRADLLASKLDHIGTIDIEASPKSVVDTWCSIRKGYNTQSSNTLPLLNGAIVTSDFLEREFDNDSSVYSCVT
ncbi:hypothetical protein Misp06_03619 [Microbulbifer sp. NBRC 101763]|uniref:hypothetical protein n=1 Tax=Microbulbifer sp. NBRC 101763 TaxID=1113820 RepID=UPI00309851A9